MQSLEILLASLSSIGIAHAMFMAALLFFWNRGSRYLNRMLSLLLIAFAIRISKSVLFFLLEQTPDIAPAIGVTGQAAIGPALFLYIRDFIRKEQGTIEFNTYDLIHFLPAVVILFAIPFHTESSLHYTYLFVIAHLFCYLAGTMRYVFQHQTGPQKKEQRNWVWSLFTGTLLIWGVYVSQLVGGSTLFYLIVTSFSAFILFGLSFMAMRNYDVLNRMSQLNGKEEVHGKSIDDLTDQLEKFFERERLFTDPDLTLDRLSKHMNVPSYVLSKVINHTFQQTFPEYVNAYRIREAERMLKDSESRHLSIEAIAFDCGFNSLSAFYNVFKKHHEQTPAQFREQSVYSSH